MEPAIQQLEAMHFIALRSLSRSRWQQGLKFDWKFNRTWRIVTFWDVPALDAIVILCQRGLVEDIPCPCGCGRDTIQLTMSGKDFVAKMNARQQHEKQSGAAVKHYSAHVKEVPGLMNKMPFGI